jgi:hypothetical protein
MNTYSQLLKSFKYWNTSPIAMIWNPNALKTKAFFILDLAARWEPTCIYLAWSWIMFFFQLMSVRMIPNMFHCKNILCVNCGVLPHAFLSEFPIVVHLPCYLIAKWWILSHILAEGFQMRKWGLVITVDLVLPLPPWNFPLSSSITILGWFSCFVLFGSIGV